jgi:hypothetical protein
MGGKLHLQTAEGTRSICDHLTILVGGVEPAEATVVDKRIQIVGGKDSKGSTILQATAERVIRSGAEGALMTLEGNAKLVYARNGHKADVCAERISVNLVTGQIVAEMDAPRSVTPIQPAGSSYPVSPPAPTTTCLPMLTPALGAHY